jgi:hypothetical protein
VLRVIFGALSILHLVSRTKVLKSESQNSNRTSPKKKKRKEKTLSISCRVYRLSTLGEYENEI